MSRHPLQIESSGNSQVLQMRFAQPRIGTAPQSCGAHPLRDGPFDPGTTGILLHKGGAGLHGAALQQGRMHLWGREGERAAPLPAGTLRARWTGAAGGRRKADDYRGLLASILRLGPAHTVLTLRTGRDLPVPIEGKVGDPIAALLALLP